MPGTNTTFNQEITSSSLALAQFRAFAHKMPALYLSVGASKMAIAYVFSSQAPGWLCLLLGIFAPSASLLRAAWWIKHRDDDLTAEAAAAILARAQKWLFGMTAIYIAINFALYHYGDQDTRMMLILSMLSSAMCSFFCLMQLRSAALIMVCLITIPCLCMLLSQDTSSAWAIACNITVVTAAMVFATQSYTREFANLVEARDSIAREHAKTEHLSRENRRLANIDMLTDLPNRRHFFSELATLFEGFAPGEPKLAIGIIDLDGFKQINDLHGHRIGDGVLREVGRRLRATLGDDAIACRLGGDEFALIVQGALSEEFLVALGERALHALRQPIRLDDVVLTVSGSIGFAVLTDREQTPERLYDRADHALYHAKRLGRGRIVMSSQRHEDLIKEQAAIEAALRTADLEKELHLVFQPIVEAATGRPLAFEGLARWTSPTLGAVAPATFIAAAERAGLITGLTPILLRKALQVATTWPPPIRLSFNLSAHDVASAENIRALMAVIAASGFDPRRIDMEITETAMMSNADTAVEHVNMLKKIGIQISIDDFGTGYSSISYLNCLPVDKVKIDKSFVKDLGTDNNSSKIVRSLIALCRDMSLTCIVEGVETAEQLEHLKAIGCTVFQGYHFARPMPPEAIASYLTRTPLSVGETA